MLKDTNKYLNNEDDCYSNQRLIGYEDVFRGVIVKD